MEVATIGHSTHPIARFLELLTRHRITAIADVRSAPYSRHNPQFNREPLKAALKAQGIAYAFLGQELGARSDDPEDYDGDRVSYARLATGEAFKAGVARVLAGATDHRIALMCAEKDPLTCHRTILVARALVEQGAAVRHLLADGTIETHDAALVRLMNVLGIDPHDLFAPPGTLRDRAYREQEARIAYVWPGGDGPGRGVTQATTA